MNLVPVNMYPRRGHWVVLHNSAMGYVARIDCLYVIGRCDTPRQAKKVATALNAEIEALDCGDYFSIFRAETLNGEFPVGAKMLNSPLRVATPAIVRSWIGQYLPPPIEAADYDYEASCQDLSIVRKYGGFNPVLDGAPCSVQ